MERHELKFKIGNDNGNSEHDIIIEGHLITQPNVYSPVLDLPNLEEISIPNAIKNIDSNLIVSINSPSAPAGTYFIGDYALKNGSTLLKNIEVGPSNKKLDSELIIINTLAQIAGEAAKKAFESDPEFKKPIDVHVDMTTSLPVKQYSKQDAELFSEKFTKGSHSVMVMVGTLTANVTIFFDMVRTLPESVPIVFALQSAFSIPGFEKMYEQIFTDFSQNYDEFKTKPVNKDYFKKKKILHVAIGEGTTEFPITEGMYFLPHYIRGENLGIGNAIAVTMPKFIKENSLPPKTKRQFFSTALRNESHKYNQSARQLIRIPLDAECEAIKLTAIEELDKSNNDVDIVCCHGGGSILAREFLYNRLKDECDRRNIKLLYIPKEYAVILESLGLYAFTCGPVFNYVRKTLAEEKAK